MKTTLGLMVTVLVLVSCAVSDQKQESKEAAHAAVPTADSWATQVESHSIKSQSETGKWLESFNDPLLSKLVAEGLANNFDLQVAAGNMNQAWLLAEQSGAALKPTVNLSVGGARSGVLDSPAGRGPSNNTSVGLQASWELDLWGRIRSGVNAAEASAQAAEADYKYSQYSLSANIAKSYLKVIEAKQQEEIARKNLGILKETMRVTQAQYDNGVATGQDVALNKANLAAVQGQLASLEGSERDALRALEVLLGRYPSASVDIPGVLPKLPAPPPAGMPSEMLERRPDLVSAERQIAAAFNITNQAKAARLPSFSLTASVNSASSSLSDVLNPANAAWQLGANLLAPIFDGGQRRIQVEISTVEQKQAIANYAQSALNAFSEVEQNLDQSAVLAQREISLSEVQTESAKAYHIASLRYNEGEIDLLDSLQIQQQAISAESNLIALKGTQLEQRINLYLALGGDW